MSDYKDPIFDAEFLDGLLGTTDLSGVSAEPTFEDLPDGYYLCEVEESKLKESKSTRMPMAAFRLRVVEDGVSVTPDGAFKPVAKSQNRKIFINYVLKDDRSIKRFATDMLKFEGETPGEPLLSKEYFTNSNILADALELLAGFRIYVQVSTDENSSTWRNLISWKRVELLGLPK